MEIENELDKEKGMHEINVTPLVNVCLVLVLIFLVTSKFFIKPLMPVRLPAAVSSKTEDRENITISISPDDGFAVNEVPIKKEDLIPELKKQIAESGILYVLIRADERIPYGEVERVMKVSRRLGIKNIAFGTAQKGAKE